MTVEECNGRLEGKGGGGDLKHEGVGGAFVIINGLSDKDHDSEEGKEEEEEKKGENGDENVDKEENGGGEIEEIVVVVVREMEENNGGGGGSLRGNGEDEDLVLSGVAEEKDEAMESSSDAVVEKDEALERSADAVDDELERDQGGKTSVVEAQALSEESDAKVEGGGLVMDADGRVGPEVQPEKTVVDKELELVEEVAAADTDIRGDSGVAVAETDTGGESGVAVAETDNRPESEVTIVEDDSRQESEVTIVENDSQQESEVTIVENDSRQQESEVAELPVEVEDIKESGTKVEEPVGNSEQKQEHTTGSLVSEEHVIEETDNAEVKEPELEPEQIGNLEVQGLEPETELSVFGNDDQKESQSRVEAEEHIIEETDNAQVKEPELEPEQIDKSEVQGLEPDHELSVFDNDDQKESQSRVEAEVHVIEETDNAEVKGPELEHEQIGNSEVQGLKPESEFSDFDNDNQKESQSPVEVEVKEVRAADHLEESELDQTNGSSISESGEHVIQETAEVELKQQPEALVAEDEKVGASEVDQIKVEEQGETEPPVEEICKLLEFRSAAAVEPSQAAVIESNISESLPVENEVDEMLSSEVDAPTYEPSNISESLPLENEVDEMPSSTADAPTYESSNSLTTCMNRESDSVDDNAPTAEKDENEEVVHSLEVDESNGSTNEIETEIVTEKEPDEMKTKKEPDEIETEKEHVEDPTDAATLATLETAVVKRHHIFMVKVPRFTKDEQLEKKIQQAASQLEEKTRFRDSVQEEIRKSMAIIDQDNKEIVAASAEENAARLKYTAKRKELEGVQVLLNRINCAVSIADIDEKIRKMVHRQQHETIGLRQEKQYIHEINQMKRLREQLSLKSSSQEQTDDALSQRSEVERQFENLKKELAPINDICKSAKDRKQVAWKRCNDEKDLLRNLRALYHVANGVRQEAYARWVELRKQSADKFKHFGMYKADQNAAATYRFSGDNEGLRSHCDRQVERIMELWNNNDDFRKEYMKSNVNSTLRRLGTLDGRSLGPDEEAPAIISHVDKRPNNLSDKRANNLSLLESRIDTSSASEIRQEYPETQELASTNHRSGLRSSEKLIPQEVMSTTCDHQEPQKEDEKDNKLEELAELARKEEQLRKDMASAKEEEAAAELKEKIKLEQKAKAKEAVERKKRKEEKNKAKAEQRAQKEADLKEQKKAKKEKKGALVTNTTGDRDGETVSMTDIPSTSQGAETTSSTPKRKSVRVAVAAKQDRVQPLPLPLRNRGRRKMTTWLWAALIAILVLLLFLAGNYLSF